jgi:hypothetical protein
MWLNSRRSTIYLLTHQMKKKRNLMIKDFLMLLNKDSQLILLQLIVRGITCQELEK